MTDKNCKYFEKITSLVPYTHEEEVCSEKIRGPKEIYDFDAYRCDCSDHLNCDIFKNSKLERDVV